MDKRGIILKAVELFFAAILMALLIYLLVNLILPALTEQKTQSDSDYDFYLRELKALRTGERVPVRTVGTNYQLVLYAPSAKDKPSQCDGACFCLYLLNATLPRRCEVLSGVADTCGTQSCLAKPVIIVTKQARAEGELDTIYFCKDTTNKITMTKDETAC